MKRFILFTTVFLLTISAVAKSVTPAASLPTYYKDIDGKSGKSLFDAVHVVAKVGYSSLGYSGLWTAYRTTDVRDNGKIWDMYSDCSWTAGSDQCGGYSNECDCYNREHSIPKSWFGGSESGPGCDIFQVVPTDGYVNNRRSNYAFGEVSSASYTYDGAKLGSAKNITITGGNTIAGNTGASVSCSGTVFEPRDEYKGDFARGYFGTMIKWAGDYQEFTTGNGSMIFSSSYSTGAFGLTKYGVALLMKWHRQDPVSQKEIDRNNGIQQTQGNRNPFIDYPYLVEYIWGEMSGEILEMDELLCSADGLFELGVSNGYLGEVTDKQVDTVLWMVGDMQYDLSLINHGSRLKYLPETPVSCSNVSTRFMGWTDMPIAGSIDTAPDLLYTQAADFPAINGNSIYYAVFAEEIQSECTGETITINKNDSTDWTLLNLKHKQNKTDGAYWILANGASIISPVIDLQALDSISMNIRTYQSRTTVSISVEGEEIGSVTATTNTIQRYVWKATEMTGDKPLTFTGVGGTASYGVGLNEITLYLGGEKATYINYLTHCDKTSLEAIANPVPHQSMRKILRDGQLYIQVDQLTYDCMGRLVNR